MIRCTLCSSTLEMREDGKGAVCPDCGLFYSMATLRRMLLREARDVRPDGGTSGGETRGAAGDGITKIGPVRRPPVPVRPSFAAEEPGWVIRNEDFGVPVEERRSFPTLADSVPRPLPRPKAPGFFASSPEKRRYEQALAEWKKCEGERLAALQRYRAAAPERKAYFDRFYQEIRPEYTPEQWRPFFEDVLRNAFPEYELRGGVPAAEILALKSLRVRRDLKIDFVLSGGGKPPLSIFLITRRAIETPYWVRCFRNNGLPALGFRTWLSNRRDYIVDRVHRTLNGQTG